MAHSPDRRHNAGRICVLTAAALAVVLPAVQAKDAANSTDKLKKPVGVASTVPSKTPKLVEAGDGIDGVIREDDTGAFLGGPGWVCPVVGSTFRNDWGNPRSGGRSHAGTDMFAPLGTAITAPVNGTIKKYEGGNAGLAFYLYGSDGVEYFGAHLATLTKTGPVKAGEVIATVGDSGNARGGAAHLHFEIHPTKKTKTNPYPTLATQCQGLATIK